MGRHSFMHQPSRKSLALSVGALGVVYGDIGTSPMYAFKECLHHGMSTDGDIVGVRSLIIWTFFSLVTVKYLWNIMRADNQGEGGILALMSLAVGSSKEKRSRLMKFLTILGVAGGSLLYG